MTDTNPYKTYADETILNASPMGLVVALYEGAIDSCRTAKWCLAEGDIPARTKAVNKTINILTELMRSLNDEKGGEVSRNLRRLYVYLQSKVVEAHTKKSAAPLDEVDRLLSIALEGWKAAAAKFDAIEDSGAHFQAPVLDVPAAASVNYGLEESSPYGSYVPDFGDYQSSSAFTF